MYAQIASVLIEAHAAVDVEDGTGRTPLICASFAASIELVQRLVRVGGWMCASYSSVQVEASASVEYESSLHETALSAAAWNGAADVVSALVNLRADVNYKCGDCTTALDQVCVHGGARSS